jgi:hypothetical protein
MVLSLWQADNKNFSLMTNYETQRAKANQGSQRQKVGI